MIRLFFGFSLLLTTFAHVASAQGILPTTHYKYQVTLQVTEQIARTFGDRRSAPVSKCLSAVKAVASLK